MMSEFETASDRLEAHCTGEETKLREALKRVMPIQVHDGQDYAEVFFADGTSHSTQAMTMNPDDWREIQSAWEAFSTSSSLPITPDHVLVPRTELAKLVDALGGLCDSETPMNIVQVYEEWSAHLTAAPQPPKDHSLDCDCLDCMRRVHSAPQPPSPEQKEGVTQADRNAVAEIVRVGAPGLGNGNKAIAAEIKGSLHDSYFVVRAFANHRHSAPPSSGEAEAVARALKVLDTYDAGLLGDGGGGDVEWWWGYIRGELERAHDFYQDQVHALLAASPEFPSPEQGEVERARGIVADVFERKAEFLANADHPNAAAISLVRQQAAMFRNGNNDVTEPMIIALAAIRAAPSSSGEAEAVARAIEQAAQIAEQIENDATCPVVSIAQTIRTLSLSFGTMGAILVALFFINLGLGNVGEHIGVVAVGQILC